MKPFVLGLTGGTGSGKSALRPLFEEYGYVYIDTDKLARRVTDPNLPYLKSIVSVFGNDIYKGEVLDRQGLARKAFSSPVSTAVLNLLTHPAIIEMSVDIIEGCGENGRVVIDAPLLFEAGMDRICDKVLAISAPAEKRVERIMERDNLSETDARLRIERQHGDEFYRANSDYVILNDSDIESFISKARQLLDDLTVKYGD